MSEDSPYRTKKSSHTHLTKRGVGAVAAVSLIAGVGGALGVSRGVEALSQKAQTPPNAEAVIKFGFGGSDWLAANGLLKVTGNSNGDPRSVIPSIQEAQNKLHHGTGESDVVQPGEELTIPVSVDPKDIGAHYSDFPNPADQQDGLSPAVEVQLRPIQR